MTPAITVLLDAAYALLVAAAAVVGSLVAGSAGAAAGSLAIAALYLLGQAVIADRRTKSEPDAK